MPKVSRLVSYNDLRYVLSVKIWVDNSSTHLNIAQVVVRIRDL